MAPKGSPFAEEWSAIHEHYSLLASPEEAVKKADAVVKALKSDSELRLISLKEEKRRARKYLAGVISWWVLGIALFFAALFGAYSWYHVYQDDWGGYDKSKVYGANSKALTEWYGKNDNVDNFRMIKDPTRDRLAGKEAWLTIYARPDNGKRVCVRVREREPYYNISENEGCDISSSG